MISKYIWAAVVCLSVHFAVAQNSFTSVVRDSETQEPLIGVSVYFPALNIGAVTDQNGKATVSSIPDGSIKYGSGL